MSSRFRDLPSVDRLLSDERIVGLYDTFPREVVAGIIRTYLAEVRRGITEGVNVPGFEQVVKNVIDRASALLKPGLKKVVNATGVILHTNLGRAPLSERAIAAMSEASRGYNDLEFDLASGERGSRHTHIEPLLCQLTGAEAALVVNNNAGAVLLGLAAVARRKEVIISRGQEVQIGGGFRVSEVMRESGAKLVEVGTTNCTYIQDYEQAITPRTAALLRVHTSNFKVTGFTETVTTEELVALGKKHNIAVLDDIGSGCLFDTTRFGLDAEPTVQESLSKGADLVFFSGDKLLGGPQAGIVVGKKVLIDKLKKHSLARALRIDKTRLAGLYATLTSYLTGTEFQELPILRMLAMTPDEIKKRAEAWAKAIGNQAKVIPGESAVGGGSLPGSTLPTHLVSIRFGAETRVLDILRMLREGETPVVARVSKNTLLLDPRCVLPDEDKILIETVKRILLSNEA